MACKKHRWSQDYNLNQNFPVDVGYLHVKTCTRCHLIRRQWHGPRSEWVDVTDPIVKKIYRKAMMAVI